MSSSLRAAAFTAAVAAAFLGCSADAPNVVSPPHAAASLTPSASASASASATARAGGPSVPAAQPAFVRVAPGLTVNVAPSGPSLIAVSVEAEPTAAAGWSVDLERHQADQAAAAESLTPSRTKSVHSAVPGASYFYRFRVAGGAWSSDVEIHTGLPTTPPPPPTHVVARSNDAFTAALAWEGDASAAAGFEIEVTSARGAARATVVDPDTHAFLHLGRRPGATYLYRVRSFNPAGVSEWSAKTEITLPTLGAPAALSNRLAPCTKLPANPPDSVGGIGRDLLRPAPDELVNEPDADNGMLRHLIGRARGCLREVGTIEAQADITIVEGVEDAPFPMLSVIAGAGQFVGADFVFLRFDGTVYARVHEVLLCGEPYPTDGGPALTFGQAYGDDPRTFQPPFDACQEDLDLGARP